MPKGQIVTSIPPRGGRELEEAFSKIQAFASDVALPTLISEVELAPRLGHQEPITNAALDTMITLGHLGPSAVDKFPISPVQIFELNYVKKLAGVRSDPEFILDSGAGGRLPEIWGMMDYADQLWKERLNPPDTEGMDENKVIFGKLPPKVHCAEPFPDADAKKIQRVFGHLLPPCMIEDSGKLLAPERDGLLLTNNTHQDLLDFYPRRTVDQLIIMRLDPNSLIENGAFDSDGADHDLVYHLYEATRTLTRFLRLIKPRGHAIFTVGSGNNENETAVRKSILSGLRECLTGSKIPFTEIFNPMAQLINRHDDILTDSSQSLHDLLPLASLQALAIPFSYRIDDLAGELEKPGPSGFGTDWTKAQIRKGINSVVNHPELGLGVDEIEGLYTA